MKEGLELAIRIAAEIRESLLSEEYAVGQPLSSIQERFAIGLVIDALRKELTR